MSFLHLVIQVGLKLTTAVVYIGNVTYSNLAGPGSIPGWVNFLAEVLSWGVSSTVRQMSGNFGHIRPRVLFDHNNHKKT